MIKSINSYNIELIFYIIRYLKLTITIYSEICSESCSSSLSNKILHTTKLDVVLTNKGLQIYGTWSTEKLLKLLTNRLKQCINIQSNELKPISSGINDTRLWIAIHSGLYSNSVLKELKQKGISIHNKNT